MICKNPNCEKELTYTARRGLCAQCYDYWLKHREFRVPKFYVTHKPEGLCSHCREKDAIRKGLCARCYDYQWEHKRARPSKNFSRSRKRACKICGRPRTSGKRFIRGRCIACYTHWKRYSIERTKRLIENEAPLGWCDCGKPATREIELSYGHLSAFKKEPDIEKFLVCEDCYRLETT